MEFVTLKNYTDVRINKLLADMFKMAVKDKEWQWRFECGGDFEVLTADIDGLMRFLNNDCHQIRLNNNMWYICQDCLSKILDLYDLDVTTDDTRENVLVVRKGFMTHKELCANMSDILQKYFDCSEPFKENGTLSINGEHAYARLVSLLGDINELVEIKDFSELIDELDTLAPSDEENVSKFVDKWGNVI